MVRAPEVYAWSGNQILGNTFNTNTRGEEITYYDAMPDFTDWCNSWWPEGVSQSIPNAPEDAIEVTPENYANITFEEGKSYILKGEVPNNYTGILFADLKDNVKLYISGVWYLFDNCEDKNIEVYILPNGDLTTNSYDSETYTMKNVKFYNSGLLYIYDSKETINSGCEIYNFVNGKVTVEQNYEDDNSDLSLDPLIITQPIYSIGEVTFKGGVSIKTDETYFKQVCVDGQMTVKDGKTTHIGYLNCDELYCHDGAKVEMAPEGAIIAGTISMIESARIFGSSKANGFILTNHILGENLKNNGEVGNKMESEVNKENFDEIFNNVNILVTQGINNEGEQETVEAYKPTNGKTIFLGTIPFDASNDDDNFTVSGENGEDYEGVKTLSCGLGYEFIPKTIPDDSRDNCEKCGHPSHGDGTCEECKKEGKVGPCNPDNENEDDENDDTDVVIPGITKVPDHVEVNLAIDQKEGVKWLASHLSIHVRANTDVEVFIPIPMEYVCEADDLAIVQMHKDELMVHGGPKVVTYNYNNHVITLTVTTTAKGITVKTEGIEDSGVIEYLKETYGDGLTFEIWNYFNIEHASWYDGDAHTPIDRDGLKYILDGSTISFTKIPDLYVNAFMYETGESEHHNNHEGIFCDDCLVTPTQDGFNFKDTGYFYNGSPYNERYWKEKPTNSEE